MLREAEAARFGEGWQRRLHAGLDASQRQAVSLALAAQDVALIHGAQSSRRLPPPPLHGCVDQRWLRTQHPGLVVITPKL